MKPEVNGALAIKRAFPGAVLVFLLPDRFSYLQQRLRARRTETHEEIARRLAIAHHELKVDPELRLRHHQRASSARAGGARLSTAVRNLERFRIRRYDDSASTTSNS